MSTIAPKAASAGLRMAPPPVSWRSWPLAAGGAQAWLVLSLILIALAAIAYTTGNLGLAVGGGALVSLAGWRLFVPVVFEMSPMGLTQHVLGRGTRVAWSSIERAQIGREGVFLSLDGAVLSPLRGLYVPWETNRDEVLAQLAYYLPRAEGLADVTGCGE